MRPSRTASPRQHRLPCLAVAAALACIGTLAPEAASRQTPATPIATEHTLSKEEILRFLRTARIVGSKHISKGITQPLRLTLDDGTMRHDAAFSTIDEQKPVMQLEGGRTEVDFVDSYRYTLAAYGVAELLGLDGMMPPTVERVWQRERGALAWWIDAQMDEGDRLKRHLQAPNPELWNQQMFRMRVFAQLVADTDRNVGNVLIDHDWHIWMVDFTRAFRRDHEVFSPGNLTRCDRALLARLRSLTRADVEAKTKAYLGRREIEALLARRDRIVTLYDALIREHGEGGVLY